MIRWIHHKKIGCTEGPKKLSKMHSLTDTKRSDHVVVHIKKVQGNNWIDKWRKETDMLMPIFKPKTSIVIIIILGGMTCLGSNAWSASTPKIGYDVAGTNLKSGFAVASGENHSGGQGKGPPLTLDACVRIALDKNPSIQAAREGVAAATEGEGEAKAPYYPELALNAGYSRWERHAFLPSGLAQPNMPTTIGPTDDWITGLKARYILFDSGERLAKLRAAISGKGVAEGDMARIRQDIALEVHQSYYGLVSALKALAVAGKNLDRAEDHLRLARERKSAGAVPQADVVRAQARVADEKLALVRMENLVRIAKGNLNTAMGLSAEVPTEVEIRPEEIIAIQEMDIGKAYELAIRRRPEIKIALQRIETAKHVVDAAKSAFGPKVRLEGGYGRQDEQFFPNDPDWMVGVAVELPIFTGFSRTHRLGKTKSELLREEANIRMLIQNIRREVWSANSKLRESYEEIQAAESLVKEAAEGVRLTRERYAVGAGTITELLDTQTALARADAIRVEAIWSYHIAKAVLNRAIGELITE
jgi:outer membrane protein TolC